MTDVLGPLPQSLCHRKQVEGLFLSQCGPSSGTSSLPGQTPSEPLENHSFTFSKTLPPWGEAPIATSPLQRGFLLAGLHACHADCTLAFPLLNSFAPSCPASFILSPLPAPLLSHFGGLVEPWLCSQVLDGLSAVALVRTRSPAALGQSLLLCPWTTPHGTVRR